jgi:glycosyltransferase involved in cell wall biosynthesis
MQSYKIAFVLPAYNESENLVRVVDEIAVTCEQAGLASHFVLINDGSNDNTLDVINDIKLTRGDAVTVINHPKNLQKALALQHAFLNIAEDVDFVCTMDADGQDDPRYIIDFIAKIESGYDMVMAWRQGRAQSHNQTKALSSRIANTLINKLYGMTIHDNNCGFKLMKREVTECMTLYSQYHRYLGVFAHLSNYKVGEVQVEDRKRISGESKYGKSGLKRLYFLFDLFPLYFLVKGTRNITWFTGKIIAVFGAGIVSSLLLAILWQPFLLFALILLTFMLALSIHTIIELLYFLAFKAGYETKLKNNVSEMKHKVFPTIKYEVW